MAHMKSYPISDQTLLPGLQAVMRNPQAFRDYGVEDLIDDAENTFCLDYVGSKSLFRHYVCEQQDERTKVIPGNEHWIRKVETAYVDVLTDWKPRLDHVMAPLNSQDGEPMWRSWHRLVMPMKADDGRFGVRCFVAKAPVDIIVI